MSNALLHFKKICVHKFWVAHYCFKLGLYWQGLVHDLSKLSHIEFSESVKYYQGTSSPINAAKADKGYSLAWQHHKGRNPHHYEYWTDRYDDGTISIMMPYKYAAEMVCDYLGAARAYLGKDFTYEKELQWWYDKSKHCKMHRATKEFMTAVLQSIANDPKRFNKHTVKLIYHIYCE